MQAADVGHKIARQRSCGVQSLVQLCNADVIRSQTPAACCDAFGAGCERVSVYLRAQAGITQNLQERLTKK